MLVFFKLSNPVSDHISKHRHVSRCAQVKYVPQNDRQKHLANKDAICRLLSHLFSFIVGFTQQLWQTEQLQRGERCWHRQAMTSLREPSMEQISCPNLLMSSSSENKEKTP